jgi:hypothetical protein
MARHVGPTIEGSFEEWRAGEARARDLVREKVRTFLFNTVPASICSAGLTAGAGYGKHKLEEIMGDEDAAFLLTKIALLSVPGGMSTTALMLMYAMHLRESVYPVFTEEVRPFGPRAAPDLSFMSWEEWLYQGCRVGRWQSMDGSGRAGAVARIPIMDEHVFIAARHRMGKSTLMWAIMEDLEEAIADCNPEKRVVRIILFDPKNGMEMAAAAADQLRYVAKEDFYFGSDVDEISPLTNKPLLYEETFIKPLEDLVALMRKRADRIRFHDRRHHAVPGDPHIIVMIDECAQLVRETTPTEIKKRIINALLTLEHQGAASGITVICATQYPSIEEIGPIRHGLTFGLCGKVKSAKAVDMVLGEESRRHGSKADKLPRKIPGIFYSSESGPLVFRSCNSGPIFKKRVIPPPEPTEPPSKDDQEQEEELWKKITTRPRKTLEKAA